MHPVVYHMRFPTGQHYVGSAGSAVRRRGAHFSALRKGVHKNWKLQQAYNENGLPEFSILGDFETLANARAFEEFLLLSLMDDPSTLNLCFDAKGALLSDESRELISKSLKGRMFTDEHRARIGKAITGRHYSPETRAKIGAATALRRHTQAIRDQISQSLRHPRGPYATSDRNIYEFEHVTTSKRVEMEPYEMRHLIGSKRDAFSCFMLGKTRKHKGWRIIKKIEAAA